jgi:S-DNA-T family DNA segregation ATPase FtsK/SpoIIIE
MAAKHTTRKGQKATPRHYQRTARGKPPATSSSRGRTTANSRSSAASRSSARNAPARRSAASQPAPVTRRRRNQPSLLDGLRSLLVRFRRPAALPGRAVRAVGKPPQEGMSLDRKLDLAGVVMLFAGLLTLLSLLSSRHNIATGGWLAVLGRLFGWGGYLFPIGLAVVGLWLVLRSFERIPRLGFERLVGLILLFLNSLGWLTFLSFPQDVYAEAALGGGGGYVGGFFFKLLYDNLGWAGAAIGLLAWLIIALMLALDVSLVDMIRWGPPLVVRVQDALQDWRDERRNHQQPGGPPGLPGRQPGLSGTPPPPSNFPDPAGALGAQLTGAGAGMAAGQPRPWVLPTIEQILEPGSEVAYDDNTDRQRAQVIEETMRMLGAPVNVVEINRGPTITQFGVEPDYLESRTGRTRVRVAKIASLVDDLALALSARTIRVEAPVPGKGFVGIEVPNDEIATVALREVIDSEAFRRLKTPLRFALGQDVSGNAVAADLSAMPHLLIAGQTGSGKSVCVNALICCYLLHNTPDDLRLIMVDPKRVELTIYAGIPHLLAPVVVDTQKVVGVLQWVLREMDLRYHKLAQAGTRNIAEYNARIEARGEKKLPRLVVFIDELADLMMLAPEETQTAITRLAQLARATGIHLVIATQRPSVEVVTGIIKANFPARIAFAVASNTDSRVILDQPGAERLLGRGDMLFQAPDAPAPIRLQGTYVSENEIQRLVSHWSAFQPVSQSSGGLAGIAPDTAPEGVPLVQMPLWEAMKAQEDKDSLLDEAVDICRRQGRASISMLQRRLRIGYTRAARLVETMQDKGLIGKEPGPQGFEILDYGPAAPPVEEL